MSSIIQKVTIHGCNVQKCTYIVTVKNKNKLKWHVIRHHYIIKQMIFVISYHKITKSVILWYEIIQHFFQRWFCDIVIFTFVCKMILWYDLIFFFNGVEKKWFCDMKMIWFCHPLATTSQLTWFFQNAQHTTEESRQCMLH